MSFFYYKSCYTFELTLKPTKMKLPNNKMQNASKQASGSQNRIAPQDNLLNRIEEVLKKHNHQFGHLH